MNTRLPQDAAEALAANEQRQKWRADAKADAERAKPYNIVGRVWFEPLTEQDRAERAQQIAAGELPF